MSNPWDFDTVWATECDDYPTFVGSECSSIAHCSFLVDDLVRDIPVDNIYTGLDHLEGETVSILADGVSLSSQTVVGGLISLPASYTVVHIGLPYHSDLETLDIDITNDRDTTMARKIKVGNVNMGFVSSHGGFLGEDADSLYEAFTDTIIGQNRQDLEFNEDLTTLNGATVLYDGIIRRPLNAKWKHGGNVFFRQVEPKPVHITSIEAECSIGGSV